MSSQDATNRWEHGSHVRTRLRERREFEIFAQSSAPDWGWSGSLKDSSDLGDMKAFKEFAFPIQNTVTANNGPTVTFCASDVVKYGFKIQASQAITSNNDGWVHAYIQSMTVYPAGGYAVGAGGTGGAAGAANVGRTSGAAGVAGSKR